MTLVRSDAAFEAGNGEVGLQTDWTHRLHTRLPSMPAPASGEGVMLSSCTADDLQSHQCPSSPTVQARPSHTMEDDGRR